MRESLTTTNVSRTNRNIYNKTATDCFTVTPAPNDVTVTGCDGNHSVK